MSDLRAVIRAQRLSLIEDLNTLTPQQWASPSLCKGWSVQQVAAHLAWAPALRPHEAIGELLRARLNPNRFIHDSAVRWSTQGQHAIIKQLRANADGNVKRFGVPWPAVLVDAVVHALDIRQPLGSAHAPWTTPRIGTHSTSAAHRPSGRRW